MTLVDGEGPGVSFQSAWRKDSNTSSCGIQTDKVSYASNSTQVKLQKDAETEYEPQDTLPDIIIAKNDVDRDADGVSANVQKFLEIVGARMIRELSRNSNAKILEGLGKQLGDEMEEENLCLHTLCFDYQRHFRSSKDQQTNKILSSVHGTCVSWNATGSVVAASYGRFNHTGWCNYESAICLWNIFANDFNPKTPSSVLENSSGMMCVSFHPVVPGIIAGGSYNGEVIVWNIGKDEPLVAKSKIGDYFHREPISQISWMYSVAKKEYQIISISGDGKMLVWSLSNQLEFPVSGNAIVASTKPLSGVKPTGVSGGTAMTFREKDRTDRSITIGTEGGLIIRYKRGSEWTEYVQDERYSDAVNTLLSNLPAESRLVLKKHIDLYAKQQGLRKVHIQDVYSSKPGLQSIYAVPNSFFYDGHSGPVYALDCSPFHRSLFLSCSADGNIKLYNVLQRAPLLSFEPSSTYLFSVAWSKTRPTVFAAGSADGIIYIYDLSESTLNPVVTLEPGTSRQRSAVYSLEFNPKQRNLLASTDADGQVNIWKLNWKLSNLSKLDQPALDELAARGDDDALF